MPARIEGLETEQLKLYDQMADPNFYKGDEDGDQAARTKARLETLEGELLEAFARWEELEALA